MTKKPRDGLNILNEETDPRLAVARAHIWYPYHKAVLSPSVKLTSQPCSMNNFKNGKDCSLAA